MSENLDLNKFKQDLLISSIKQTVLTNISKDLRSLLNSNKVDIIKNSLSIRLDKLIASDADLTRLPTFSNQTEFEGYILKKANQLRVALLKEIKSM